MKIQTIKIYTDSGADISFLKPYFGRCKFCTFPYDSSHRRKKPPKPELARPSEAQWRDCHVTWDELYLPWNEFSGSSIYKNLKLIVGEGNRLDILQLDSAYKENVNLFLTSDKDDIWNKRKEIEELVEFKIFHTPSERIQIIQAVENFQPRV